MKLKCFLLVDIFANCVLGLIFRPKKRGGGGTFSKGSFLKRRRHILLSIAYLCQSGTPELSHAISYPEPSNFLRRMLNEDEGLWKGLGA